MAGFDLCPACRSEYDDPRDRRFHAQPTACARCGPRLELLDDLGRSTPSPSGPLLSFANFLRQGGIGALKGLGGFHLACDARHEAVVATLRRRKGREAKPFAVMVRNAQDAAGLCKISPRERALLESSRAPIVLLERREDARPRIADAVAPASPFLGLLLPYTPLHHLLLQELGGIPLVMTSGNRAEEPIATDDRAVEQLRGIADVYLVHDRPIQVRCDDSVTRVIEDDEAPIRRSRGYAPQPLPLPIESAVPTLAVGGQLKSTFALARGNHAFLSHHLGDLDQPSTYDAFRRDVELYQSLLAIHPCRIVHDLHPDYASTEYARTRAVREGWEVVAVQHHHAHMASCMAENGLTGPVIGVTFDGAGYGLDGTIWGGEFLIGDYRGFRRAAHLEEALMPGGEQAVREPWRMAVSYLTDAGGDLRWFQERIPASRIDVVRQMLLRKVNCPRTSSAGRLFDGVSSLLGVRDRVAYEGQAAIELETLARSQPADGAYAVDLQRKDETWIVRVGPMLAGIEKDLCKGVPGATIARRFHSTMAELIRTTLIRLREESGLTDVVLSGGVFMNELLLRETLRTLRHEGFSVFRHRRVPANDGGLSLGQLAVAAAGGGHRSCA
jgi:hydrogenase maturation protein HypF